MRSESMESRSRGLILMFRDILHSSSTCSFGKLFPRIHRGGLGLASLLLLCSQHFLSLYFCFLHGLLLRLCLESFFLILFSFDFLLFLSFLLCHSFFLFCSHLFPFCLFVF